MSIKRMLMLAGMALAAILFAAPAAAQADEFLHEGEPIGEAGVETSFAGGAGFSLDEDPETGVHCGTIHFDLLATSAAGHVEGATFTNCTTTSSNPEQEGWTTHATAVNRNAWTVTPDTANSRLVIDNVHINNKVTHPVFGVVVSESTLKGTMTADVIGSIDAIETVALGDENATVQFGIPPEGEALDANVAGDLSGDGTIGLG